MNRNITNNINFTGTLLAPSNKITWELIQKQFIEYERSIPGSAEANLIDISEIERRRAYILNIAAAVDFLALCNLDEPESLFIEPAHCFTQQEVSCLLANLPGGLDLESLKCLGLDILDPQLVRCYLPIQSIEASIGYSSAKIAESHCSDYTPAVLFDPLYGMALVQNDGQWRQICFAEGLWHNRVRFIHEHHIKEYLTNTLEMLSEGVLITRQYMWSGIPESAKQGFDKRQIPEIIVQSPDELYETIKHLESALSKSNSDLQLWFRGQPIDYLTPDRTRLIDNGMAKYCSVRDSSLIPSLYRNIDHYNTHPSDFMRLVSHIGDWIFNAEDLLPSPFTIHDTEGHAGYTPKTTHSQAQHRSSIFMAGKAHLSIPGINDLGPYALHEVLDNEGNVIESYIKQYHPSLWSFRVMLLLQHYGCPTPYIDITHDSHIAMWFALHNLSKIREGKFRAQRITAEGDKPEKWPTIYVFALSPRFHPVIDTASILSDTEFLRPQVQRCGLLGGAGNLARNYPARFIAVKLRLGPGFGSARLPSVKEIFPPSSEDIGLNKLLECEQHAEHDWLFPVYDVIDD